MNAVPSNYKTKWIIQENQEFCVFCLADENNWICQKNQCLYAIINNGETILGQTNERMAKFPIPKNNNPFHGFPVSRENISEELLDKWETSNIITPHLRRKLVQCKI
jgi:hypothetical protein